MLEVILIAQLIFAPFLFIAISKAPKQDKYYESIR